MLQALHNQSRVVPSKLESVDQRLRRVIDLHFDPVDGSRFWLDRAAAMGFDPRSNVRTLEDLDLLGHLTAQELRARPLLDFVPRALHELRAELVVAQTG